MNFFSTPVFSADLENCGELNSRLEKYAYGLESDQSGVEISNRGGFQSEGLAKDQMTGEFFERILPAISDATQSLNIETVGILGAWININGKHNYNTEHCHSECDLAGVYYIKTPKDCGQFYINNPIPQAFMNVNMRQSRNSVYAQSMKFDVVAGRIFIFPGWLFHGVEPNQSGEDRISLAFNLKAESFFGNDTK